MAFYCGGFVRLDNREVVNRQAACFNRRALACSVCLCYHFLLHRLLGLFARPATPYAYTRERATQLRTYRLNNYDMAARHQLRALTQTPELGLSDAEDSYSSSEEEMPERDETDHLLRQAHHYVITEGGNDPPTTYMERIQRINQSLIHEISRHGYDCDSKLYRRVKQKVDHVLREFEDAVDADSSVYDYEEMPEYYTAATEGALYLMDSSPLTPDGPPGRRTTKLNGKDDIERTYRYGDPGNHPENWYKNAAESLPFPETIHMADGESMRIHWDFATTGNVEKIEPVISNGVSFNDPRLVHHNSQAQYESGSRFKLPAIDPADMAKVNEFGTVDELHKAVDAFNQSDDTTKENGDYKYAPRVFLDRLDVGQQDSPQALIDVVRSAVNTTPTRPRTSSTGSSKISSAPSATETLFNKQQQQPLPSGPGDDASSHTVEADHHYDNLPVAFSSPSSNPSPPQATIPEPSSRNDHDVSPAIRRIKAATEASIRSSSLPPSPPAQPEAATQVATHVSISAKRPRGRPRKHPLPEATELTVPAYQTTATRKRKHLSIDATVEAQAEERVKIVEEVPAKRKKITQTYGWYKSNSELRREPSQTRPCTPTTATEPETLHTPAMTLAETPALTPASSAVSTPPVAKARTAGKQRKVRTKRGSEERVSPERSAEIMTERSRGGAAVGHESIQRRSTRSVKLRAT
ncbi:hypothetical protein BU25DRAFT_444757 [Macroventuria anomochaeta]|uniref:Uncharacterized protein n=1 Tax=Macroventuria anomochaeta TaxID=301207 RepID=A0ACB6SFF9_9PLEO|nr:uncharacterized protein BU25DRAFT_444757 [Macroventuria anomochaeta]KAF2632717.1 hypothetical protein BU25DRAFT_444757 [Macroventuria anomochaeta]